MNGFIIGGKGGGGEFAGYEMEKYEISSLAAGDNILLNIPDKYRSYVVLFIPDGELDKKNTIIGYIDLTTMYADATIMGIVVYSDGPPTPGQVTGGRETTEFNKAINYSIYNSMNSVILRISSYVVGPDIPSAKNAGISGYYIFVPRNEFYNMS